MQVELDRASAILARADALLITAGAGMGIDSGLPDYRGAEGFWNAYPPFRHLGLSFAELSQPQWFERDPELVWGFYGHRLQLYRRTVPHSGFGRLRDMCASLSGGVFVYTSNVDGQFQKAGFDPDRIVECHGSLHHLQAVIPERDPGVWPAGGLEIDVDDETCRARRPLPTTPAGEAARPNVLLFGDASWIASRTAAQEARLLRWLKTIAGARLAVVECGAGVDIPTVRRTSERIARRRGASLIRLNPRDPEVPDERHVSIATGASAALEAITERLARERPGGLRC